MFIGCYLCFLLWTQSEFLRIYTIIIPLYQPWLLDESNRAVDVMKLGEGKRNSGRNPASVQFYSPWKFLHEQRWD